MPRHQSGPRIAGEVSCRQRAVEHAVYLDIGIDKRRIRGHLTVQHSSRWGNHITIYLEREKMMLEMAVADAGRSPARCQDRRYADRLKRETAPAEPEEPHVTRTLALLQASAAVPEVTVAMAGQTLRPDRQYIYGLHFYISSSFSLLPHPRIPFRLSISYFYMF